MKEQWVVERDQWQKWVEGTLVLVKKDKIYQGVGNWMRMWEREKRWS